MAGDLPRFLRALPAESGPEAVRTRVQEQDLQQWGLTGERRAKPGTGGSRGSAGWRRPTREPARQPGASRRL